MDLVRDIVTQSLNTTMRLRDLIKAVRSCKTAAEERAVVAKECANIRTSIAGDDTDNRQRNVAKLLYIHMLGYPTHFGHMECLKLIVSPHYSDKRVGYLGLALLLDERQEVLMLVTNSLRTDLNHPNQYVVGLALCALANISSPEIARDTAPEVKKLLDTTHRSSNPYTRKKAALCAIRIMRKVPELAETFVPTVRTLLSERIHGCLITGASLAIELCELDYNNVEQFRKMVPNLVKLLKSLVLSGFAPEYDVGGITDPFLQVKLLRLLRILGRGDAEASEQMNDILAQVATNTENLRNVGNAILYECVQTIMNIDSEAGLRVLAINLLGRFLLNRDNNIRYVALNTLSQVVAADVAAVQRHRNTIVDCLRDPDVSIRRRALELVYALVNDSNVKALVRELLNFLTVADAEFKPDLTAKLCSVTEKYAPSKRWHIDTILRIMSIAGQHVPAEVCATLVTLIGQSPELHAYAAHRMYLALNRDIVQQALVQVAAWTIGEYGELLVAPDQTPVDLRVDPDEDKEAAPASAVQVAERQVLELLDTVLQQHSASTATKEVVLTALLKLADRFRGTQNDAIGRIIARYQTHIHPELQQRACEYSRLLQLIGANGPVRQKLLERIPPLAVVAKPPSTVDASAVGSATQAAAAANLIDITGLGLGGATAAGAAPASPAAASAAAAGAGAGAPSAAAAKAAPGSLTDILDIFSTPAKPPAAVAAVFPAMPTMAAPMLSASPLVAAAPARPPAAAVDPLALLTGALPTTAGAGGAASAAALLDPFSSIAAANGTAGGMAPMTVLNSRGLLVVFELSKSPSNPQQVTILATAANSNPEPLGEFLMQVAVPKYCTLQISPPSGTEVAKLNMGKVTQSIVVTNAMQGQKPLMMKLKIDYKLHGQPVCEQLSVTSFPPGI